MLHSVLFIAALIGHQDSQMDWAFRMGVQTMSTQREKNGYQKKSSSCQDESVLKTACGHHLMEEEKRVTTVLFLAL